MPKTHTVKVNVPSRQDFHGFYSAQRHLPPGKTTLEGLTPLQLKELKVDDEAGRLTIMDVQDHGQDDEPVVKPGHTQLDPEEAAAVAAVRAQKALRIPAPAQAQSLAPSGHAEAEAERKALQDAEFTKTQGQHGKHK